METCAKLHAAELTMQQKFTDGRESQRSEKGTLLQEAGLELDFCW